MEIILSSNCNSFTGSLGRGFGYYIKSHLSYRSGKESFFSQRNSKGSVPPDGHLKFIFACAELAQNGLHIADIRVSHQELSEALSEAGLAPSLRDSDIPGFRDSGLPLSGARHDSAEFLSSSDILTLKERMSL